MNGHDAYDVVTLVVAIAGLALGLASVVWQTAQWRLAGPRMKVEMHFGAVGPGGLVTSPDQKMLEQLVARGFTPTVLVARVRNKGRTPIAIEQVSAALENGVTFMETNTPPGTEPLPHKLEGLCSATWYVRALPLVAAAKVIHGNVTTAKIRMAVSLGTGKTIYSDWKQVRA